jgi:hypothetical protein
MGWPTSKPFTGILTVENIAPPSGVEGRVVAAIRADPALLDYVRSRASERNALEAGVAPRRKMKTNR